jgi:hypothetical protein
MFAKLLDTNNQSEEKVEEDERKIIDNLIEERQKKSHSGARIQQM